MPQSKILYAILNKNSIFKEILKIFIPQIMDSKISSKLNIFNLSNIDRMSSANRTKMIKYFSKDVCNFQELLE